MFTSKTYMNTMYQKITKAFVINKISDHLDYYYRFLAMLDKKPDLPYSDEQMSHDNDIELECIDILEKLMWDEISPEEAYTSFNSFTHARLY